MDRRTTIKWVLAAAGAIAGPQPVAYGLGEVGSNAPGVLPGSGYGTDPDLIKVYRPGELWPLTLTEPLKDTARVLCDLIIPSDPSSPSASEVGVVEFIDEWISAPYKGQRQDRAMVLEGFAWLDAEAASRYDPRSSFAAISYEQQTAICDDICLVVKAQPRFVQAANFFARYRDLTAGGFYTTPQGRQDVRYVGNVPLPHFDGPPPEVLQKVGLA
jgi:gluconate 2-dehydrogenase subunit 3-like protein